MKQFDRYSGVYTRKCVSIRIQKSTRHSLSRIGFQTPGAPAASSRDRGPPKSSTVKGPQGAPPSNSTVKGPPRGPPKSSAVKVPQRGPPLSEQIRGPLRAPNLVITRNRGLEASWDRLLHWQMNEQRPRAVSGGDHRDGV